MEPLKILLPVHCFFPNHFYGTETYTLELAKTLRSEGHEVSILTAILYGEESTGELYTKYEYDGLPVHCVDLNSQPLKTFKQMYVRPDLYPVLRDILALISPDIAHVTHLMGHTSTLLEVLRDLEIPTVATLTDFFGICTNSKLRRYDGSLCLGPNHRSTNCLVCYLKSHVRFQSHKYIGRFINNDIALKIFAEMLPYVTKLPFFKSRLPWEQTNEVTDRIDILRPLYGVYRAMIAPTDFLFDAYIKNCFNPKKLRKINFGINLDLVEGYRTCRRKKDTHITFGYIGQITHHKGIDLLIRAFSELKGNNSSLMIYGPSDQDSQYMDQLKALSRDLDKIEFKNTFPQTELASHLSKMDILVIPSRWYENSPLVLLYALATRTPVIVTDVKGMNEFVKDGFNGYTFKMDNVQELLSKMQKVADDPSRINRLSENANYLKDVSDHTKDILAIYEQVLKL